MDNDPKANRELQESPRTAPLIDQTEQVLREGQAVKSEARSALETLKHAVDRMTHSPVDVAALISPGGRPKT